MTRLRVVLGEDSAPLDSSTSCDAGKGLTQLLTEAAEGLRDKAERGHTEEVKRLLSPVLSLILRIRCRVVLANGELPDCQYYGLTVLRD